MDGSKLKFKTAGTAVLILSWKSSGRETGAALCTAAGQDLAAVAGLHTLHEAVLLLALTLLGLIGTNHFHTS